MVHTFRCLDRFFMLDIESGSFYQIDELTKNLIDAKNSPSGIPQGEFLSYSKEEIAEALSEIDDLEKEGALYSIEKQHIPLKNPKVIKSMCLNVSHKCNLRCTYCFADGGSYKSEALNMPLEVAKKAVDFIIAKSGNRRTLEIDFFGGEPLLNFDVVKQTVEYARSQETLFDKVFRFTLTTNAVCLTDEIIDFLNKEMYNVVLSIDGRKEVHNMVRKTVGGKDSFDEVLKNSLKFREKRGDKQYYVRGTFTKLNKDFSKDVLALNDYGFDQISLEPVVLPDSSPLAFQDEDINDLVDEYEVLARKYLELRKTPKWFSFFHFNIDVENGPCETKRLKSCGAGCEYVAISPNGDIYPCHQFDGNKKYYLGNILKNSFDKNGSSLFDKNTILFKNDCSDCWAKYHCSGGCAANQINFKGTFLEPVKNSCALMRKRIECALAIYSIENE